MLQSGLPFFKRLRNIPVVSFLNQGARVYLFRVSDRALLLVDIGQYQRELQI